MSVIIPVYNAEKHIEQCIYSIKNQSYYNLEIIIINDGSTDTCDEIIRKCINKDERFTYISRENRGLVETLNQMILMCNGLMIARMDADDISHVDRIKKQVNFLCQNDDVAVLGSRVEIINESGVTIGHCKRPVSANDISVYFLYGSPLAHPTVIFNMEIINKIELTYSAEAYPVEDLELWLRLQKKYKILNLKNHLLKYRISKKGVSQTNKKQQEKKSNQIRLQYLGNDHLVGDVINAVDSNKYSITGKALITLFFLSKLRIFNSNFKTLSLFKLWIKTIMRDCRKSM
ncbi:glycosyltransferase [Glaciimonas sp. Cout2]|uniref:glycosyltransferase family 2 protein n=1 Tax=Glaciimonas sp. Cout2 TaxID=3048621 RepID=UPI002B22DE4D|nr:glycosyltransferase [Glaciimonas sp. Cout2]MEB0014184.1 glycosyltransferase [Glaciimonas sp. Cout2]